MQCPCGLARFGEVRAAQRLVLVRAQTFLRVALSQFSPRLYIGSRFLWYSFILLVRRVSDGVTGSVFDHVGYNSGTVLVYCYALTGPAALYAPEYLLFVYLLFPGPGLGGRGTLRHTSDTLSVWATLTLRSAPELACTGLLYVRKREFLVIVKVVQDDDDPFIVLAIHSRRVRLAEDLRVSKKTEFRTSSMVRGARSVYEAP